MHPQLLKPTLLGVLMLLPVGCGTAPDAPGELREAVIGGEETGPAHAGVLYVTSEVRELSSGTVVKIGTGALVAPNLLLTALHVVSKNPSNVPFTCDASGSEVSGSSGALLGSAVSPSAVAVYTGPTPGDQPAARGAKLVTSGSSTICQNDIAFVVLDTPLDLPIYRLRRASHIEIGDVVDVVGFGSGPDMLGAEVVRSERRVSVTDIGQWIRTFTVSEGPCEGDSGGPALDTEGLLAGVFSSVAVDCSGPNAAAKYTDVSYFEPLVQQAFDAADAGSPWPGDAGNGGGSGTAGESTSGEAGSRSGPARKSSGCQLGGRPDSSTFAASALSGLMCCAVALSRRQRRRSSARPKPLR